VDTEYPAVKIDRTRTSLDVDSSFNGQHLADNPNGKQESMAAAIWNFILESIGFRDQPIHVSERADKSLEFAMYQIN